MSSSARSSGRFAAPAWRALETSAVLLVALACYLSNGRTIGSGDTLPNRYLPIAMLRDHTLALDGFPFLYADRNAYWVVRDQDHWVSFYPTSAALLAAPFYVQSVVAGEPPGSAIWEKLEKRSAAVIAALATALLFATLRRLTDPLMAVLATTAFGLGSSHWSVASQGLWQHGPTELGLCGALYCLVRGRDDERWVARAGLPLAFAAISRPTAVALGAPIGMWVLLRHTRSVPRFALWALPILALHLGYNARYHGSPFWTQFPPFEGWHWKGRPAETLAGLLFSPGRGLFVYSPIFAFSFLALASAWRHGGDSLLRALGLGIVLALALLSRWKPWWGGATFGPRLLCDLAPMLAVALHPWAQPLRSSRALRGLFAAALAWSVAAHAIGVFWDDGSWNAGPVFVDLAPRRLWVWSDNQLVNPVAERVTRSLDRARGVPIPFDPEKASRLRRQIEADPRTDRAITALRALEADAHDLAAVADLDRLRAKRFTPPTRVDWDFGGELTLLGYGFAPVGDDGFDLTYYWRAERRMTRHYFAAVHVECADARLQDDHAIGPDGYGTTRWLPGETISVVRRIALPKNACRTDWALRLGVWSPADRSVLELREGWIRRRKHAGLLRIRDPETGPLELVATERSPRGE